MVSSTGLNGELSTVVVKFGGFHLIMSYLGAIDYIMSGSGLNELWPLIYAPESIEKMLSGDSYACALRAHFLTQFALSVVILRQIQIDENVSDSVLS